MFLLFFAFNAYHLSLISNYLNVQDDIPSFCLLLLRPPEIFAYQLVELLIMFGEEFPQLRYHFGIYVGMAASLCLTQTLAITHLRPQTIKSFGFIKIKIVTANPLLYACERLRRKGENLVRLQKLDPE